MQDEIEEIDVLRAIDMGDDRRVYEIRPSVTVDER